MLSMLQLCGVVALVSHAVYASSLEFNPVTQVGELVCLNHDHPAYGAEPPVTSKAYAIEVKPNEPEASSSSKPCNGTNNNSNSPRQSMRRLELSASEDLQRLESFFGQSFERDVTKLALQAAYDPVPWPSSYWPTYQDSINHRIDPTKPSPAEKYARAFNLNVGAFQRKVSEVNGILSMRNRQRCNQDEDCASLNDGSVCGKRRGASRGVCIPTWFGICHAWAPAAIMEKEPKCPVTINRVTFTPFDIKALLTMVYDGADLSTVFTGARFNGPDNAPDNTDDFGRFKDPARRDLGPGFFHLAVTNIMGQYKKSFVIDVTAGAQVWNQPVRRYEILDWEWLEPTEAAQRFYNRPTYPFNDQAVWVLRVTMRLEWIVEATEDGPLVSDGRVDQHTQSAEYKYLLEVDEDTRVLGGEWIQESNAEHPDFLWFPAERPSLNTVTKVGISFQQVHDLLTASVNGNC